MRKMLIVTMVFMVLVCFCFCNTFGGEELDFAVVTDLHVGKRPPFIKRLIFDAMQIYQDAKIRFVLATGDLTQAGLPSEYIPYSDVANSHPDLPWYSVPGNHDLNPDLFEKYVGPRQWVHDIGEYRIIGVDTNDIDFEQLDFWLATSNNINIICGHHPPKFLNSSIRLKLEEMFQKYQVLLYFCGHVNSDHIVDDGGTTVSTCHTTAIGCYQEIRLDGRQVIEIQTKCPNLIANFKGQWSGQWFKKPVLSRIAISLDTEFKEGRINLVGDLKLTVKKNSFWELISIPLTGQFNDGDNTLNMAGVYEENQILLEGVVKFDSKGETIDGSIKIGEEAWPFSVFASTLHEVSFW